MNSFISRSQGIESLDCSGVCFAALLPNSIVEILVFLFHPANSRSLAIYLYITKYREEKSHGMAQLAFPRCCW